MRPKDIGTVAETAVVRYLAANGFPYAERRALRGALDCGDVTGCGPIVVEVKGGTAAKTASDTQVALWLLETQVERYNANADIGVLVLQRAGVGVSNAGRWWAVLLLSAALEMSNVTNVEPALVTPIRMHLADAVTLLRVAGYGTPLEGAA